METKVLESEGKVEKLIAQVAWSPVLSFHSLETSIPPQQCHKRITSMPRRIETVIQANGAPTMYWVNRQ